MSDRLGPADPPNPLSRSAPLGGASGVAIASLVPITCVALFVIVGFLGGWAWSWIILLAIPLAYLIVYGPRRRRNRQR